MFTAYSCSDGSRVLEHPSLAQCVMTGQGDGQIAVTRAQDASRQDVAHDGSVMTTKIGAKNGELSFTLQQTSAAHKWLKNAYRTLLSADTAEWAAFSGLLENPVTGDSVAFSNACVKKLPDESFQQAGQTVTWTLLCGCIEG